MDDFLDFYRNVTYCDSYDENGFIGKWVDDGIWVDAEYIKLERAILCIGKSYPYPTDLPRDLVIGLYRIVELLMVSDWMNFDIQRINAEDESTIFERFERLKVVISQVLWGEDIQDIRFGYNPY